MHHPPATSDRRDVTMPHDASRSLSRVRTSTKDRTTSTHYSPSSEKQASRKHEALAHGQRANVPSTRCDPTPVHRNYPTDRRSPLSMPVLLRTETMYFGRRERKGYLYLRKSKKKECSSPSVRGGNTSRPIDGTIPKQSSPGVSQLSLSLSLTHTHTPTAKRESFLFHLSSSSLTIVLFPYLPSSRISFLPLHISSVCVMVQQEGHWSTGLPVWTTLLHAVQERPVPSNAEMYCT